jgi:hypothetical protein
MYSMKRYCLSHRTNAEIAEHAESLSKMFVSGLCGLCVDRLGEKHA